MGPFYVYSPADITFPNWCYVHTDLTANPSAVSLSHRINQIKAQDLRPRKSKRLMSSRCVPSPTVERSCLTGLDFLAGRCVISCFGLSSSGILPALPSPWNHISNQHSSAIIFNWIQFRFLSLFWTFSMPSNRSSNLFRQFFFRARSVQRMPACKSK